MFFEVLLGLWIASAIVIFSFSRSVVHIIGGGFICGALLILVVNPVLKRFGIEISPPANSQTELFQPPRTPGFDTARIRSVITQESEFFGIEAWEPSATEEGVLVAINHKSRIAYNSFHDAVTVDVVPTSPNELVNGMLVCAALGKIGFQLPLNSGDSITSQLIKINTDSVETMSSHTLIHNGVVYKVYYSTQPIRLLSCNVSPAN